ncbi:MAG: hypothetical protein H6923_10920 [Alphaproteobacteria bacterium]|nr:hypothetical protein [Alphaproteobacteria bacterium]
MFLHALVRHLMPETPELSPRLRHAVEGAVTMQVARFLSLAPLHVRLGAAVLTLPVRLWLALRAPGWTRRDKPAQVRRALDALQAIAPLAAAVRIYRTLTVLAFYEHPFVAEAMGESEPPESRQAAFRARRRALLAGAAP